MEKKKRIFKAKLLHSGEEVTGQLVFIGNEPHIIQDSDIAMDGHHFRQTSDTPTWVDKDTIEEVLLPADYQPTVRFATSIKDIQDNKYFFVIDDTDVKSFEYITGHLHNDNYIIVFDKQDDDAKIMFITHLKEYIDQKLVYIGEFDTAYFCKLRIDALQKKIDMHRKRIEKRLAKKD